jgi:hypothetical protein
VEREYKCGSYCNFHRINIKKAMGLQEITKILTMCEFLDRCAGRKVDRGACGTNAQIKNDLWA